MNDYYIRESNERLDIKKQGRVFCLGVVLIVGSIVSGLVMDYYAVTFEETVLLAAMIPRKDTCRIIEPDFERSKFYVFPQSNSNRYYLIESRGNRSMFEEMIVGVNTYEPILRTEYPLRGYVFLSYLLSAVGLGLIVIHYSRR